CSRWNSMLGLCLRDKAQPETQARSFGSVAFNALLAVDDPDALPLVQQPGSDGFKMESTALFQVSAGREWYIHTIYTVRSRDSANRGIGKRSLEYHHHALTRHSQPPPPPPHVHSLSKRSTRDVPDIAEQIGESNNRGTNILHIALDRGSPARTSPERTGVFTKGVVPREVNRRDDGGDDGLVLIVGVVVGLLLTALVAILVVVLVRSRRERKEKPKNSNSAEPMVTRDSSDSSEV
uniref:Uncharacterized protein n=1 Tax=Neogobius melanostomus TaxID=47308 RepID=A0A8C6S9M3_9GOBI